MGVIIYVLAPDEWIVYEYASLIFNGLNGLVSNNMELVLLSPSLILLGYFAFTKFRSISKSRKQRKATIKHQTTNPTASTGKNPLVMDRLSPHSSNQFDFNRPLQPQPVNRTPPPVTPKEPDNEKPYRLTAVSATTEYRLPANPESPPKIRWVPPGESIEVWGTTIPGGLIYFGTAHSTDKPLGIDNCLIDPSKPVAANSDYAQNEMDYWPSYAEISPASRRTYLNWLAGGRSDPDVPVGHVFLFFYGLERRVILDLASDLSARSDRQAIAEELCRLLAIYGKKSKSFTKYACQLLNWLALENPPPRLYERPVPILYGGDEPLFVYLQIALGQASQDAAPVPPHLALAWAKHLKMLPMPALRCQEQFDTLFTLYYTKAFDSGMVIPKTRTKLDYLYNPASSGFHGRSKFKLNVGEIPDITSLTGPVTLLKNIVKLVTQELDAYSRFLSKSPSLQHTLEGYLLLPYEMWPAAKKAPFNDLKTRLQEGDLPIQMKRLLTALGTNRLITRSTAKALVELLESMHIGMEPDVLSGANTPNSKDTVVLFNLLKPETIPRITPLYHSALLTLQIASLAAMGNGKVSEKSMAYLRSQVLSWNHVSDSHPRLLAHLLLLSKRPVSLPSIKKKLDRLDITDKEPIASFMMKMAQVDTGSTPEQIRTLEKLYQSIGLASPKVIADLFTLAAQSNSAAKAMLPASQQPGFTLDHDRIAALQQDTAKASHVLSGIFTEESVSVAQLPPGMTELNPPDAQSTSAAKAMPHVSKQSVFTLDHDRIAALQQDTARVSAVLFGIFTEEESLSVADLPPGEPEAPPQHLSDDNFLGLDGPHSSFARTLLTRTQWNRNELVGLTATLDIMLDGAIEHINDLCFDLYGIPFTEGDDPIEINTELRENLVNDH